MIEHGLRIAAGAERVGPGEHLGEYHAEAVDVAARIEWLALGLLRAAVGGAADGDAEVGELVIQLYGLGYAEVGEHHAAVVTEEDIGWLHVSMD